MILFHITVVTESDNSLEGAAKNELSERSDFLQGHEQSNWWQRQVINSLDTFVICNLLNYT